MTADPSIPDSGKKPKREHTEKQSKAPILIIAFAVAGLVMAILVLLTTDRTAENTRAAQIPSSDGSAVGWQVPAFEAQTLNGETINITDYRGQVVFLNFWATWCIPCQREMPAFSEFMAQGRDDAVVLAVNNGDEVRPIRDFINLFGGDNVPILLDPDYVISDGFGVKNLPTTYVLNGDGVVQHVKYGEITAEDIEAYITAIQSES